MINHKLKLQPRKLSISIPHSSSSRDSHIADPIDPDTIISHRHHPSVERGAVAAASTATATTTPVEQYQSLPPNRKHLSL